MNLSNGFLHYLRNVFREIEHAVDAKAGVLDIGVAQDLHGFGYCRVIDPENTPQQYLILRMQQSEEPFLFLRHILDTVHQWITVHSRERASLDKLTSFYSKDGIEYSDKEAAEHIVRSAAEYMTGEIGEYLGISFEAVDILSLSQYEKEKEPGRILFAGAMDEDTAAKLCTARLRYKEEQPLTFTIENIRNIRKLIAGGSKGKSALLFACVENRDSGDRTPMCIGYTDSQEVFPVEIKTVGAMEWDLLVFGQLVLHRRKMRYAVPSNPAEKYENVLKRVFSLNSIPERLLQTIDSITKQEHGASVIIARNYEDGELGSRVKTLVEHNKAVPFEILAEEIRPDFLTHIAKMDGAILVRLDGSVAFINVILDGKSKTEGKLERGARFNSLSNFIKDMQDNECAIVGIVHSEDGGIDVFPELPDSSE